MTIGSARQIAECDRREIDILLAEVFSRDTSWIFAHPEVVLSKDEEDRLLHMMKRRRSGEPMAYILGRKDFYGRKFFVDERVLIPRPSTETLIESTVAFIRQARDCVVDGDEGIVVWSKVLRMLPFGTIVDVGTGSGCIAVTLAMELKEMQIIAIDSSESALAVARENAERLCPGRVTFLQGDTLLAMQEMEERFLVVSNPPYIPSAFTLSGDTLYEPISALKSGPEGTDIMHAIMVQAQKHPACVGWILECREEQVATLSKLRRMKP